MKFLYGRPHPEGVALGWLLDHPDQDGDVLELVFARVVLGVSLESPLMGVAVGQRVYTHPDTGLDESVYVVLDETTQALPMDLFDRLIAWKDQYQAQSVYTSNRPAALVDSLRRLEGLALYPPMNLSRAQERWPTFQSFDQTAGVVANEPPDETRLHRDLEVELSAQVSDPLTGRPLTGKSGEPVTKLQLPPEFPTQTIQAGLRQAAPAPCLALWWALQGMRRPVRKSREDPHVHRGNPITGY